MRFKPLLWLAWICIVGASLCAGGCSYTHVKTDKVEISSVNLFTDRGISKATLDGMGSVEGYQSGVNVEAIKAVTEAAVSGAVRGAVKP